MNKEEAQALLQRYHDGTCTPAEKERLDAWFAAMTQKPTPVYNENERDTIAHELKSSIDEQIHVKRQSIFSLRYISVAASLIVVCGITLILLKYNKLKDTLINKNAGVVYTETYAPQGHRVKIVLNDGSEVTLNGGSRLRYPQSFGPGTREVSLLEGEAFFDIHHDEKKMFIVEALGTHTYVLGTAFNIRAYKVSKEVQITVTRGKVSVKGMAILNKGKDVPVTLLPNDQVSIVKATGSIAQRHIKASDYTVWVDGKYKFNNETLGHIATVLDNAFDIHIAFAAEDLKDIRFSSEFNRNDKLEDLLFAICRANNLTYNTKNGQVTLAAKPTN